uniref:Uncharacterized protein n=1 Tax=Trichuris muris TaxID=70415 RepID=A0A5S6QY16_TRIMR
MRLPKLCPNGRGNDDAEDWSQDEHSRYSFVISPILRGLEVCAHEVGSIATGHCAVGQNVLYTLDFSNGFLVACFWAIVAGLRLQKAERNESSLGERSRNFFADIARLNCSCLERV